ncbi:malate:quinone oxidoreductase [Prochlorococcus marinus]|uniref:malate:quinone oxidoreductase n=1 Tax=Prochlorococcus marinus TaxID=1219 RepID=UPI0022B4652B|nr:malate:quinone oxidoreductase [Prochlorococcus marinus]
MFASDSLGSETQFDAVLVGAGIMSSTLAVLLHELEPDMKILIVERLHAPGLESSCAVNNSGTGHAANCEFNYTPLNSDGSLNIDKALAINASFERSLEFWSSMTEMGKLVPDEFLHALPHVSCVWSQNDISYLRQRFLQLSSVDVFKEMEWSDDKEEIREWIPLMMKSRQPHQKVAATRMARGTDIDFGALTCAYLKVLEKSGAIEIKYSTEVIDIQRANKRTWQLSVLNEREVTSVQASFLFLGAGGGALSLLKKSGIAECYDYGGFPVSGKWLVCNDEELANQHNAKVYGTSAVGAPPMSVPHLDSRWIEGKKSLLFGPFAGFNTKFLKNGSNWDFFRSIQFSNVTPMIQAGLGNYDLIKYLISQLQLDHSARMDQLRDFFPEARSDDWQVSIAGQRVQIIKKTSRGGLLKFGTEVVSSSDGTLAALLGASPGASTAVSIMLEILKRCWSEKLSSNIWQERLKKLLPSYGKDLKKDRELFDNLRSRSNTLLGLG